MMTGDYGTHQADWESGFRLVGLLLKTAVASGFAVNILTLLASLVAGAMALGIMRVLGLR